MPRDFLDRWLGVATQESMYSVMYVELRPSDDVLSALGCLYGLEFLSFDGSKLSIENIRAIPQLSGVVELQINDEEGELSKEEISLLLSKFPSLQEVTFEECGNLRDEILRSLPASLRTIMVEGCENVAGVFLDRTEGWPEIESIFLRRVPIRAATVDAAARFKTLDTLWLQTTIGNQNGCDFSKLVQGQRFGRIALFDFGIALEKAAELEEQAPDVKWVIRN